MTNNLMQPEAFNTTSRYVYEVFENSYFEGMANHMYQPQLQLNKGNTTDTEVLHLSIAIKWFCLI